MNEKQRQLIGKLAANDFKARYSGSYLGFVWALVQPVVTVVLYYFVFEVIFDNRSQRLASGIDAPYVLWLTAGLVPWFYFNEMVMQGMQAFLQYHYLVKKVVFEIRVLPLVKLIASSFVHVFFLLVLLLMYFLYGQKPDLYLLQLPYYSLCLFFFVLGLSYITSSVVVFFRDLTQIFNILLQIGMWATPILWDLSFIKGKWVPVRFILKLNPVYYVVNGYREALFDKRWFWQDVPMSLYFWGVSLVVFLLGRLIYKRLKPHLADVL
ncbi:MAG: ABC transporter permease [Lachnospiraceae bacterium]|nr:ABC transporter permease [Lachnospiraceae bacterium]